MNVRGDFSQSAPSIDNGNIDEKKQCQLRKFARVRQIKWKTGETKTRRFIMKRQRHMIKWP